MDQSALDPIVDLFDCLNREIEDYPPPMTALARDHRRPWLF